MKCFKCDKEIIKSKKYCYDGNKDFYIDLCVMCHSLTSRKTKTLINVDNRLYGINDTYEANIVRIIFILRDNWNYGSKKISRYLNECGHTNRKGNKFLQVQVERIFKRRKIYIQEGIIDE